MDLAVKGLTHISDKNWLYLLVKQKVGATTLTSVNIYLFNNDKLSCPKQLSQLEHSEGSLGPRR